MKKLNSNLDKYISLEGDKVLTLFGKPGIGKTTFGLKLIYNLSIIQGISTVIFSLESSKKLISDTIMSFDKSLNNEKTRCEDKIFIEDRPGITIAEIEKECRKLKQEKNIQFVFIDYLQLIGFNYSLASSQKSKSEEIIQRLNDLSQELNISILVINELSGITEK